MTVTRPLARGERRGSPLTGSINHDGPMALADWFLSPAERENPHARIDAVRGNATGWSVGNDVRPIVHGAPYFAELAERVG